MWDYVKLTALALVTLLAAMAANFAHDLAYQVNAIEVMIAVTINFACVLRQADDEVRHDQSQHMDGVIRAGVIATAFGGIDGFLVGRHRRSAGLSGAEHRPHDGHPERWPPAPLHISAVIFAFGGNALIMSSFYVVQRPCAARLWGGHLAWSVFWGWQLMVVLAASSYILGGTQSKEYAETVW